MLAVSGDVEELSDVNEHTLLNAISCSESSMTWVAPAALSGCHCSTHVSSMSRSSRRILLCLVTGPIERVDADPQIVTTLFFSVLPKYMNVTVSRNIVFQVCL